MAEMFPALPVDLSDLAARDWCGRAGLIPLPATPATVGAYLSARAGVLKVSTLNRRLAAITVAHRTAGLGLDGGHPGFWRPHRDKFGADFFTLWIEGDTDLQAFADLVKAGGRDNLGRATALVRGELLDELNIESEPWREWLEGERLPDRPPAQARNLTLLAPVTR